MVYNGYEVKRVMITGRNDPCPCGSGEKYKKCCGTPIFQSRSELKQHLIESVEFLIKSSILYDQGDKAEAKRIALEIRKLLHDTDKSASILSSLKTKDMFFENTGYVYFEENMAHYLGLVKTVIHPVDDKYIAEYFPILNEDDAKKKLLFDVWWNSIVISDNEKTTFTRKDIVLCLADQDGGAHVDNELEKVYYNLTRNNTVDYVFVNNKGEETIIPNPHLATVRQIAHEIIITIMNELPELASNKHIQIYMNSLPQC
jgi:hypothetical protein